MSGDLVPEVVEHQRHDRVELLPLRDVSGPGTISTREPAMATWKSCA